MFLEATLPNLQTAAENNLYAVLETLGSIPQGEISRSDRFVRCRVSGILSPMFNAVSRVNVPDDVVNTVIQENIAYFRDAGVPYWFWWHGEQTQPANLLERLNEYGFVPYEVDAPAMAVDLSRIDETISVPSNYCETRVENKRDLRVWADTFVTSFEAPPFAGDAWHDAGLRVGIQNAIWRQYIGWLDDKPVAIGMMIPGAGIAGVLGIGTVAAARGKGIGKAITLRTLIDARAEGYKIGALFSSDMGFSVYKRIGFEQYGRISRYLWRQG